MGKGRWLLLILLGLILFGSFFYQQRLREYASEQFLMDTLVTIRVYGKDPQLLTAAVTDAYAAMHRVADLVDRFPQPGTTACQLSDVCRINEQAGVAAVRVDHETLEMLLLAQKYRDLTSGAFDVTIGPVMDLWGFAGDYPHVPTPESLEKAMLLVDNSQLVIDAQKETVYLQKVGMKLDLGAIAKGYATEKAAQVLQKYGIQKALIDAGGNIRVIGQSFRDTPWKIGIKDPRRENAMVAVVALEDEAAVTSGDYYRYFEEGGKRYHHILDPRSGYPAGKNRSVTVISKDAGLADILSTACFVLPPVEALKLAERSGVDLFLVSADGAIQQSPGLRERVEVIAAGTDRHDPGR